MRRGRSLAGDGRVRGADETGRAVAGGRVLADGAEGGGGAGVVRQARVHALLADTGRVLEGERAGMKFSLKKLRNSSGLNREKKESAGILNLFLEDKQGKSPLKDHRARRKIAAFVFFC